VGLSRLWPQRPGDAPVHHGRCRGRRRWAAGGHRVGVVPGGRGELWRHGGAGVRRHPSAARRAPGFGLHVGRRWGRSSYPLQKLLELPPGQRVAAQLKMVDSRWDQRWLDANPVDRVLAEHLTAAGQDQQDPADVAAYAAQLQARESHNVWDRLGAITCPALVGYGNYDGIAPARNSEKIASRVRGAELHGYEGGHGFLFQDPAALPAFIAFLLAPPVERRSPVV